MQRASSSTSHAVGGLVRLLWAWLRGLPGPDHAWGRDGRLALHVGTLAMTRFPFHVSMHLTCPCPLCRAPCAAMHYFCEGYEACMAPHLLAYLRGLPQPPDALVVEMSTLVGAGLCLCLPM